MATLTQFTSYDEVRAVLGVAPEELEDTTLALPLYVRNLVFDLTDLASDMDTQYLDVAALPALDRSTAQQRLYDCTQLFSAYSVSKQLLASISLFAPQTIKDGRAELDRQDDPFGDVKEGVIEGLNLARKRLLAAYAAVTSVSVAAATYTAPTLSVASVPTSDPVTGT